ncbi:MAG: 4a-hydroxytetrahydrobiopterin dehydratase [Herminiimonas sp.]|nr:4a-hydroxytetrahydrobiopterin dehydratase [Herminiimonas sp.]
MIKTSALRAGKCRNLEQALSDLQITEYLQAVDGWKLDGGSIMRSFQFLDYYRALAFVNAMAWIVHAQDHHPEITLSYNRCVVRFNTHSVNGGKGGISENDFICAAQIDALHENAPGMPGALA